ncbi:ommochrome-binding protein-like isoform X1 [Vanessa atalanta]|uniref:ommochrome-binding protein-like isoform X1 n=2 Tax=Vanessa atalanta TaxID=42275 RepID=UPI001FCD3E93|nr:ommochrome-binding protein-like isoform X1 [Vanessa atalanta]
MFYLINMKIIVLLSTLFSITIARRISCHACLNSICYKRATILKGHKFSGQLAIDRNSNVLYFHYQNNRSRDFTGAFDLDKVNFSFVPNLGFTFGHAVDQSTKDLYASGTKGIYKYNPKDNKTELFALKEITIWHMQFDDRLYYTEFQKKGLYTYINKNSKTIPELSEHQIDDFIVDKKGDIYFMSNYTIHVLRKGAKSPVLFEDEIYSLTTDKDGNAYFIQPYTRGIYSVNYRSKKLSEVGAFGKASAFKLVFDGDNHIIYYDVTNKNLFYLSPTLNICSVGTRGKHRKMFIATTSRSYKNHKKNNLSSIKNITKII